MKCPICESQTKVVDSHKANKGTKRTRECVDCFTRFTTYEHIVLDSIDKHILDKYYRRLAK
jgi:transcriptional regulator NrdR family protein